MEPAEYDDIIRHLVQIAAHQDTINTDLRAMLGNHDTLLLQQVAINQDVQTTLARIEALLARMIGGQGENGREA